MYPIVVKDIIETCTFEVKIRENKVLTFVLPPVVTMYNYLTSSNSVFLIYDPYKKKTVNSLSILC